MCVINLLFNFHVAENGQLYIASAARWRHSTAFGVGPHLKHEVRINELIRLLFLAPMSSLNLFFEGTVSATFC